MRSRMSIVAVASTLLFGWNWPAAGAVTTGTATFTGEFGFGGNLDYVTPSTVQFGFGSTACAGAAASVPSMHVSTPNQYGCHLIFIGTYIGTCLEGVGIATGTFSDGQGSRPVAVGVLVRENAIVFTGQVTASPWEAGPIHGVIARALAPAPSLPLPCGHLSLAAGSLVYEH